MKTNKKHHAVFVWEGTTKKGFLDSIMDYVDEVGNSLGVKGKPLYEIELAVEEAAANCCEHAYDGKRGKLRVEIEQKAGQIMVQVTDWGNSIEPEKVPVPYIVADLRKINLEGLGVMIMRKAMDSVEFATLPSGENATIMRKRV